MDESKFWRIDELFNLGEHERALTEIRDLEESTIPANEKVDLMTNEVGWLARLGRVKEARERFEVMIKLMPKTFHARQQADFSRVELFMAEEKYKEALKILDRLLKEYAPFSEKPSFNEYYISIQLRRGILLARLERYREALPVLEEAEKFDRNKGNQFYCLLGASYLYNKKFDQAKCALLKAVEIGTTPDFEVLLHYYLGATYSNLGAHARAKEEFETSLRWIEQYPQNKKLVFASLAKTYQILGLRDEAIKYKMLAEQS